MLSKRVLQLVLSTRCAYSTNIQAHHELHHSEHVFSVSRSRDHYANLDLIQNAKQTLNDDKACENNNNVDVNSYDCRGTVSLSAAMETMVPYPFQTTNKASSDLNMPGLEHIDLNSFVDKYTSSHRASLSDEHNYVQE